MTLSTLVSLQPEERERARERERAVSYTHLTNTNTLIDYWLGHAYRLCVLHPHFYQTWIRPAIAVCNLYI